MVFSFFSGAGGLDLGLRRAGLRVILSHDNDVDCVITQRANGASCKYRDVHETLEMDIPKLCWIASGYPIFAVTGGPPCQSFSTAGKQRGFNDGRGALIETYLQIIHALQPRFFLLENVPNLKTVPFDRHAEDPALRERGSAFAYIDRYIREQLGYTYSAFVLDAADFGVAQHRKRLILIGSRDGERILAPVPSTEKYPPVLRDVIGDPTGQSDPKHCAQFSERYLRYLRHVPQGGCWRDLPPDMQREAMGQAFYTTGGRTGFFRRLSYDRPAPTLVTSPTQKATMLCHPVENRPLSVREYARIQGFPESYEFAGSLASRYRQIGNAVPISLACALGEALLATARQTDEALAS